MPAVFALCEHTINSRNQPIVNQEQERPYSAFAAIFAFLLVAGAAVMFVKIESVEENPVLAGFDIRSVARSEVFQ